MRKDNLVKPKKTPKPKRTEGEMQLRLRKHLAGDDRSGPSHALLEQVRDAAGFDAKRTLDAISMGLWPSRGLRLTGYEIKCSRSDTLKEIRTPSKAEAFTPYLDFFYLVCGEAEFVREGELPERWGLMVPHASGLKVVVKAELLHGDAGPKPVDRSLLAAMLRQAGVAAHTDRVLTQATNEGFQQGVQHEKDMHARERERMAQREAQHRARERELTEMLGHDLMSQWRGNPERFRSAVRTVLNAERDVDHLRHRIKRLTTDAKVLAEQADRILGDHFPEGE